MSTALETTMQKAYDALKLSWTADVPSNWAIYFDSGWVGCGQAMEIIASAGATDITWQHDPPRHSCQFSCTEAQLSSIKSALQSTCTTNRRCGRR